MRRWAVFLDVDGTLVNDRGLVPDSARQAVRQARRNGHLVFLCTGRSPIDVWPEIRDIGFDGLIAGAGAVVEAGGDVLVHSVFTPAQVAAVLAVVGDSQTQFILESVEGHVASTGALALIQRTIDSATDEQVRDELELGLGGFRDSLRTGVPAEGIPVHKVSFCSSALTVDQVASHLGPEFTVIESVAHIFGPGSGEIALAGVDKGSGIRAVLDHLDHPPERTVALGDGYNDIEMFESVQIGIAMAGAPAEVRASARHTTSGPDEDGVYLALRDLGLIGDDAH